MLSYEVPKAEFGLWMMQQAGVPVLSVVFGVVFTMAAENCARNADPVLRRVIEVAFQAVIWNAGWPAAILIAKRHRAAIGPGKFIWIVPSVAFAGLLVYAVCQGPWQEVLKDVFLPGSDNLVTLFLTLPTWSTCTYSLAMAVADRGRNGVGLTR